MKRVIVRYRVKMDCLQENVDYIHKVYAELKSQSPAGLRYATFKAADSPTFFHIASVETANGVNPLTLTDAFKAFTANIRDRCDEQPVTTELEEIGSYNFFGYRQTTMKASAKPAAKSASKTKAAAKPKAATKGGSGAGTKENPWRLKTANGGSEFSMYRDETADPPALMCQVGSTQLRYDLRCIEDLHAMLKQHGDWMLLGAADEQKPAAEGTVEAWARSPNNPVGGWYGLKKGLRGRFGMYVPPLMEVLGLAELEHNPKNNRMRAK